MSYKDTLKKQILELEEKIKTQQGEKRDLEEALRRLQLAQFEEDLREDSGPQLLNG